MLVSGRIYFLHPRTGDQLDPWWILFHLPVLSSRHDRRQRGLLLRAASGMCLPQALACASCWHSPNQIHMQQFENLGRNYFWGWIKRDHGVFQPLMYHKARLGCLRALEINPVPNQFSAFDSVATGVRASPAQFVGYTTQLFEDWEIWV